MATHNDFGKKAENEAAKYLTQKGHKILERNFRFQKAEIDIISEIDNTLIITEVKARAYNRILEPYEAVDTNKKKLTIKAANHYAEEKDIDKEIRFDIISIIQTKEGNIQIQHIENAFEAFSV